MDMFFQIVGAIGTVAAMLFAGIACLRSGKKENSDLVREITELKVTSESIKDTVNEIKSELIAERNHNLQLEKKVAEHEAKITTLLAEVASINKRIDRFHIE